MEDTELNAIRAARLQEMRHRAEGGTPSGAKSGSSGPSEQTQALMSQILTPEANERLSRVNMVRPERVQAVQGYLLQMYQSGAISHKIGDSEIKQLLERAAKDERKQTDTTIVFDRRETVVDPVESDDDDDFFD